MTCPGPDVELCCDMTPCPPCPVVVSGVSWAYSRADGWHEPEPSEPEGAA